MDHRFLLYTIDVGMDNLRHESCMQDWECIERHCKRVSTFRKILKVIYDLLPRSRFLSFIPRQIGKLDARHEKRCVYILTSFIEAHQYADKKLHAYIGSEEDIDIESLEEMKVKEESRAAVCYIDIIP